MEHTYWARRFCRAGLLMTVSLSIGACGTGAASKATAAEAQAVETAAAETPAAETPANETQAAETPAAEAPAAETPADETQAAEAPAAETPTPDREIINQVSLLQGLTFGDYHGSVTVGRLKQMGDTGIGTFDKLNGELIMLDGTVYRAAHDGTVVEVPDEETIPFSNVTFYDEDNTVELSSVESVNDLKDELNQKVQELGSNNFFMVKVRGTFKKMSVRSELAQSEPYKPLATVLETDQTFFDYEDIAGTVVGLYCPNYMNDLNAVGWHFHFVSDDKTKGGHVLDLSADELVAGIDSTRGFSMLLPDNDMFNGFDLTVDQSDDIKKVETGDN